MTTISPPEEAVFLDDNHAIVLAEYGGERAGINEWHRTGDGSWCCGWVAFKGYAWANGFDKIPDFQSWDVVRWEPLTLTPSILCRRCGSHGFITDGKWVPA